MTEAKAGKCLSTAFYQVKLRLKIRRQLHPKSISRVTIKFGLANDLALHDVRIIRDGSGYLIETSAGVAERISRRAIGQYTATYLYWLHMADSSVKAIVGDTSDGQKPGFADFALSSFDNSKTLVPDGYFFRDQGYEEVRQQVRHAPVQWADRSDKLVWRGSLTGEGLMSIDPSMQAHPGIGQRLRMALACAAQQVDFKFTPGNCYGHEAVLERAGLVGPRVPIDFWASRKFAIDIDGNSNAWCNLFRRLLQGCCVLKVASNYGFKQWYYHQLEPFVHYVPVRADMSDLAEQLDWMRTNDSKAREIAAQGQKLAQSLTWESESKRAGEIITQHWNAR